jgi:hypothetical protein
LFAKVTIKRLDNDTGSLNARSAEPAAARGARSGGAEIDRRGKLAETPGFFNGPWRACG